MVTGYWQQVMATGLTVPTDRPLDDLTAELTTLLGSTDPAERDGTAYPTLATWISRGEYDDLLAGLGDGMAAGLTVGIGERDTDTVFRRSFSVLVLAECIERDTRALLLPPDRILDWGDRIAGWFLRERDVRGFVPGKGWAHAVAHGADALGALGASRHLGADELRVLLDVIADRVLLPTDRVFSAGEPDRMARAVLRFLRRDLLPMAVIEPWVARIAATAGQVGGPDGDVDPFLTTGNPEAFLRALYLQLALGAQPPALRSDLVLLLVDVLRATNPRLIAPPAAT